MSERILFVDDDEAGRELSIYNLAESGYDVEAVEDGDRALERFSSAQHDLVVTDLRMPGISGMEVLRRVKQRAPDVPVVVITAHGSVETAVEAMRVGAYDYVEKPFSRDVLLLVVRRALERRRLTLENRRLRIQAAGVERTIIAESAPMLELLRTVDRVAASEASVLITGESGTGKELVARRLHARSARADRPFVPVNCAAMPAELLESELFGHRKGSYTGATRARAGRFRRANGGTIFLDEVGEIPLRLQGKLLRVLQERTVDVIGADQPESVDVRVIAATNQPLQERAVSGDFREDLYYRLNVLELKVPPLRERPDDVVRLSRYFVERAGQERELTLPDEVQHALLRYAWPGNVRELQNACERLVVLCEGTELSPRDLPPAVAAAAGQPGPGDATGAWPPLPPEGLSLVDLERRVIERALELNQGNVSQTAEYLRIPRHVLAYRLQKYGIRPRRARSAKSSPTG